jgi:hypothetical protein
MPDWWSSVDGVAKFNNWMQVSIVVFGVLTAAATALTIVASNRISRLQSEDASRLQARLQAAEEAATSTTAGLRNTSEKLTAAEQAIQSARADAAQARASAEVSKAKLQPRTLSSGQRSDLIAALKAGPSGAIDIVAVLGDAEGIGFAGELDAALKVAGWPTSGVSQAVYTPRGPIGVLLTIRSKDSEPVHAVTLQKALTRIGIEAPAILDASVDAGYVGLIVGHKP